MADDHSGALKIDGEAYTSGDGGPDEALLKRLLKDGEIDEIGADAAKSALEAVRKRGEGWRAGTASALGLVLATLAFKDVDKSIGAFKGADLVLLASLVGLSVFAGLASLFFLLRAANGPTWLDTRLKDYQLPHDARRNLRRAAHAARDLRFGQVLLFVSLGLFAASVGLTWFL